MKKYVKILSVLLCAAMLLGLTAMSVMADTPEIKTEVVLSKLSTLKSMGVTPEFGYYNNAAMTGSIIDYQAAAGEDACLVDGNTSNSGWSGNFAFTDLIDNGGTKVPVILADIGTATTVGGIELISVANSSCSAPTHFAVQVTTDPSEDVWQTVLEAENVTWSGKETKRFAFEETVDAYKVRLVVFDLAAAGSNTQTQFALHELTLMATQEVPMVDKVPVSGGNVLQYGYFSDLELTSYVSSVLSNNVPANLFDGDEATLAITNTESWTWGSGTGMAGNGGTNTAVLTLDVTKNNTPSAINYMQIVAHGLYYYAPTTFTLQVTTSAEEDNWTTVYEVTDFSWEENGSNDYYVTFNEVSAYKARLLVAKTHVDQNSLCYFGMGEFVLGTVEFETPIVPEPTNPTAVPTEPTAAPTEPTAAPTEPTAAPTEPTAAPTEPTAAPTEPTAAPTEPTAAPTEPTVAPTEPTAAPTEPTAAPTEPTAAPTEPTAAPTEPTAAPTEPTEEPTTPAPERPNTLDTEALFDTIASISELNPTDYTAESWAALVEAVDTVNATIFEANGDYTQQMVDDANALLNEAINALVAAEKDTNVPDDEPGDEPADEPGEEPTEPETDIPDDPEDLPADTGDVVLTILSGMMTMSAIGGAAVIGKKKLF